MTFRTDLHDLFQSFKSSFRRRNLRTVSQRRPRPASVPLCLQELESRVTPSVFPLANISLTPTGGLAMDSSGNLYGTEAYTPPVRAAGGRGLRAGQGQQQALNASLVQWHEWLATRFRRDR
jgi:capsular polysaccharide biosynthesis protein